MKTKVNKLLHLKKNTIVELNETELKTIIGGTYDAVPISNIETTTYDCRTIHDFIASN